MQQLFPEAKEPSFNNAEFPLMKWQHLKFCRLVVPQSGHCQGRQRSKEEEGNILCEDQGKVPVWLLKLPQ